MNAKRLHSLVLSTLLGTVCGLPASVSAYDTEIYLGPEAISEDLRPNVLFILDTSGSMSALVDGTGKDRLDNMKEALNLILDNVNNVNVGLMRFTDPGGPVLFPVSYIDEDVQVATSSNPPGMDLNVRIAESADDAEEIVGSTLDKRVILDHTDLDMYHLDSASATSGEVTVAVGTNADDAEQYMSNGHMVVNGSTLGIPWDDGSYPQAVGMIFRGLAIPEDATILESYITFTAKASHTADIAITVKGETDDDPDPYTDSNWDVTGRSKTTSSVVWEPDPWTSGQEYITEDLSPIVQELVNDNQWDSGDDMGFILTGDGNESSNNRRNAYSHNSGSASSDQPRLYVKYQTGATDPADQLIGLRFQKVAIPQGATINRAYIEFYPAAAGNANVTVPIHGEKIGNAAAFQATDNDIKSRTPTTASASWALTSGDVWDPDTAVATPSLTDIVQEIVDEPTWCGNNAMAFMIYPDSNNTTRLLRSYDGDPSRAPVLRVDFDESTGSCINQSVQRQVSHVNDDAEETISSGSMSLGGNYFNMRSTQVNGLRFQNLPIPQGTTILSAELVFTANSTHSNAATFSFYAQDADDAPAFTADDDDVSHRTKTTAKVDWSPSNWDVVGKKDTTVNIGPVIQEVVNRVGWLPGNDLVIIQEASAGERSAYTYDNNPAFAAILRIQVQGKLSTGGAGYKTVRQELKEIIDNFDHEGHTPIVDTLYEAARYYRGEDVLYGKYRGWARNDTFNPNPNASSTNTNVRRNTRISHPASWTGGLQNSPGGCTKDDPNHADCVGEYILFNPKYTSPIAENCQYNFIILLTDGAANHNHSASLIKAMTGDTTCTNTDADETCGEELVEYLHDKDQSSLPGEQSVTTYTIGFNFSNQFLKDLATKGGGQFREAKNAQELAGVFTDFLVDILSQSTSFATPSLTVNAFNKLYSRDDVYFSLFRPSNQKAWNGNIKKYQLCPDNSNTCDKGQILDADGSVALDTDDRIDENAKSFWSTTADGPVVDMGGAGDKVPAHGSRTVLTYTSSTAPSNQSLDTGDHRLLDSNDKVTKAMLGDSGMSDTDRTNLIDWIRGKDVDDEDGDGDVTENRYAFGDPLHSSPVAVTFGGTEADPVIKLFVTSNDGGLRMIDAKTGVEDWIYYPQAMLAAQKDLRANPVGDHIHGLDATPSIWIYDADRDGVIEPASPDNDFIRVYVAMRRGGRNIYALDVTPSLKIADRSDLPGVSVTPKLMWRITGGDTEYPKLGQTWSQPKVASIRVGTTTVGQSVPKTVLLFAGGYDGNGAFQDGDHAFGPSSPGNAIYVADAVTGARLVSVSSSDPGGTSDNVAVSEMTYPIPASVAAYDSSGDGETDRLYVGDTGGQVWRVDLNPDLDDNSAGLKPVVKLFAKIADQDTSDATKDNERRKFFYAPDVVQAVDSVFSNTERYDMVVLSSGNRAHPLDLTVDDVVVAIRDNHVDPHADDDDDGIADQPASPAPPEPPVTMADLFDATEFFLAPTDTDLADLKDANGWYIKLEATGEKGLSRPIVLAGKLFFTTYLPEGVLDTEKCSLQEGLGRLYGVNLLTGAAFPWQEVNDGKVVGKQSRYMNMGTGIPSDAVPIFQKKGITLLIGTGGGARTVDPGIDLPRDRTYWSQQ